ECRLLTWMWQITTNHCLCILRKRQAPTPIGTVGGCVAAVGDDTQIMPLCHGLQAVQSPLAILIHNQQVDAISHALQSLPPRYREVLTQRLNGCTETEIASKTGWSIP